MNAEPAVTTPATTESAVTMPATTESAVTMPATTESAGAEDIEITADKLLLAHHCPEIETHCVRWECERGCEMHCDEHCIMHVPEYVGGTVKCPSGKMWCLGSASSEEREKLQDLSLEEGYWIYLEDLNTEFQVAGIQYFENSNGVLKPKLDSDIPATTYEMGWWGAAVPIGSDCMGLVYLINPETVTELTWEERLELGPMDGPQEEFFLICLYYLQVTEEK